MTGLIIQILAVTVQPITGQASLGSMAWGQVTLEKQGAQRILN